VETRLPLETVLGATIVKSANDAAVMLAGGVGGTLAAFTPYGACRTPRSTWQGPEVGSPPSQMELFRKNRDGLGAARYDDATRPWERCRFDAFIKRMNETAQRLGMTRTSYVNPNGLPDRRQVTTARDMAKLAHAIIQDFPEHAALFAKKSMRYGRGTLRSYNGLLRSFKGADGMKTGFTCASGFNIVASATRSNRRIVAVVLGHPSSGDRNTRTKNLLEKGFGIASSKIAVRAKHFSSLPVTDDLSFAAVDIRDQLQTRGCRTRRVKPRRKSPKVALRRSGSSKQRKAARKQRASKKHRSLGASKSRQKIKRKSKKKVAQQSLDYSRSQQ
ncbi:MAG: D-alanyl-D-alanine carboxypeptidase family protein, partial [Methyloligellaceae bacterium]